ncbi:MAG: replication-relaxation family protein [Clostridia bacterium]|nr:replication-relaxation family protein [Clostridia bacterium]
MEKIRGRRNLDRTELPSDINEHVSKTLPNITEHKIIAFLYDMRYARTSDLSEYLGLSLSRTRAYLNRLYCDYYLFRTFPKVDKGSGEGYYCLDKASIYYLASNEGVTVKDFGWDYRYNINDPNRMDHTIDITKIRISFSNWRSSKVSLETFVGEKKVGLRKIDEEHSLRPDGEFSLVVVSGGQKYLKRFFIEYDRGTEDLYKIKEKISKYSLYYSSGKCSERYLHTPGILIVCNGELSQKRFEAALNSNLGLLSDTSVFIAQLSDVLDDPYRDIYTEFNSGTKVKLSKLDG